MPLGGLLPYSDDPDEIRRAELMRRDVMGRRPNYGMAGGPVPSPPMNDVMARRPTGVPNMMAGPVAFQGAGAPNMMGPMGPGPLNPIGSQMMNPLGNAPSPAMGPVNPIAALAAQKEAVLGRRNAMGDMGVRRRRRPMFGTERQSMFSRY
jgi:hypothetical protein